MNQQPIHHTDSPVLEICRSTVEHLNGYRYTIYQDCRPDCCGRATLIFKDVASYRHQPFHRTNNVYNECLSRGLSSDDLVGHIRMFYPNGDNANECIMRHGIGSSVLNIIIDDTCENKGKILYVLPTTPYMENFVKKHSFTQCTAFSNQYYLRL